MNSPPRREWTPDLVGQLRYALDMTQGQFAEELGVSKHQVCDWEYDRTVVSKTGARLLDYVAALVGFKG